jgi:hypothetical protein
MKYLSYITGSLAKTGTVNLHFDVSRSKLALCYPESYDLLLNPCLL